MTAPIEHPSHFAVEAPERPAVIMASGPMSSYAQLEERSCRVASAFRSFGLDPGDHVAIMPENPRSGSPTPVQSGDRCSAPRWATSVVFVEALPRLPSGKLAKRILPAWVRDG